MFGQVNCETVGEQQIQWRKDVILSFILIYIKAISSILTLYGDNDNKNLLKYTQPFGKCSCMAYGLPQETSVLDCQLDRSQTEASLLEVQHSILIFPKHCAVTIE